MHDDKHFSVTGLQFPVVCKMFKALLAEEDSGLLGFGTVISEFY
jgi:hypothetical protein